ncbi:hypothetical protein [Streptomyces sp. NPDC004435]|uniref:hypothetical protein n=1 Tax=Streptomyces sp. NPDC004435 TaxID=3364701 RepID=UPI0036C043A1
MAKEVVSRCDECGTTEGVREFIVSVDVHTRELDLCPEHAAPLLRLYDLGTEVSTGRKASSKARKGGHAVVAIEDWQANQS